MSGWIDTHQSGSRTYQKESSERRNNHGGESSLAASHVQRPHGSPMLGMQAHSLGSDISTTDLFQPRNGPSRSLVDCRESRRRRCRAENGRPVFQALGLSCVHYGVAESGNRN